MQTAILDSMADAIVVADAAGPVYSNPAATNLLGATFPAGWTIFCGDGSTLCAEENFPIARAVRGDAFDGEEFRLIRPDGATVWVSASGSTLVAEGSARGGVVVFRDVTRRKEMEKQLFLADRMASLGTLAAGIAHEVNNPLFYVIGNLDLIREEVELATTLSDADRAAILRRLATAASGSERLKRIVSDLRTLSSGNDVTGPVDVARALEVALGITEKPLRARAKVVTEISAVALVTASEARLVQVLVNLLINAAQALSENAADQNEVRIRIGDAHDGRVSIEVSDTGTGIAPGVLPHIFDPFFTTKPVGVGTGLGLSITHSIVTSMAGEISVASQLGRGTTFRVLLPAALPPAIP